MRRAVALLALALAVPAAAQERLPTYAKDREGDVRGRLDLVRVALGKRSERVLRAELTTARRWTAAHLRRGSLCLRLHVRRDPASEPPEFLVCALPGDDGTLAGRITREGAGGRSTEVASARVTRPGPRRLHLRFTVEDIGAPAAVRFSAESIWRAKRCPEPGGCRDTAPNAPQTMRLPLRSGGSRG